MSVGLLGSATLAAATDTVLYECPATKKCVGNVTLVNTTAAAITIRIGVKATNTAFITADWVFYDMVLPPNGAPLAWTGVVLTAGNTIKVRASAVGVNAQFQGIESGL